MLVEENTANGEGAGAKVLPNDLHDSRMAHNSTKTRNPPQDVAHAAAAGGDGLGRNRVAFSNEFINPIGTNDAVDHRKSTLIEGWRIVITYE